MAHGTVLSKLVDAALILACLSVSALGFQRLSENRPPNSAVPPAAKTGDRIELAGYNFSGAPDTLLLVVSSHCPYCQESMDFYSRLGQMSTRRTGHLKLVVVGVEPTDTLTSYLAANHVEVDQVLTVPLGALPSPSTPTLLRVNSKGIVVQTWRGLQAPSSEAEIIRTLS